MDTCNNNEFYNLLNKLLDKIQDKAQEADNNAKNACLRSKYSIQDYYMCLEFWTQRLHDELAREYNLKRRCPIFPFRSKLSDFKSELRKRGG